MKKQIKILMLAGCMTLIGAAAAMAGPGHHERTPADRAIRQGIYAGELTRTETHILRRHQYQLAHARKVAWADGRLTRGEKIYLEKLRNKLDHQMYRFTHNRVGRW